MTAKVPSGLYWATRFVQASAPLWERIGNFESRILAEELEELTIDAPVFVTALARSGTTIITEFLNDHSDLTSLRYSDFPWLFTPYWRNWLRQRSQAFKPEPVERAHQDRIMVTQDSPEAYEEPLWIHFFPDIHDTKRNQVLNASCENRSFERFYDNQVRKLLLVREAKRYLAKGNYNLTRIRYLQKLYPDAKFVVPVRHPVNHIASLMKQHRAFVEAQAGDPRTARQLSASGHFEFGPARQTINVGDQHETAAIEAAWDAGDEVEGWARHWAMLYNHLLEILKDAPVRDAVKVVRYEDLCGDSTSTLNATLKHCHLSHPDDEQRVAEYASRLTLPDYYQPDFSDADLHRLKTLTQPTAEQFGYEL